MPIGAPELIIILVIALLILGPGKLPDVGSALGKSIKEFRKASTDIQESVKVDTSPMPPAATPPAASTTSTPPQVTPTVTPASSAPASQEPVGTAVGSSSDGAPTEQAAPRAD